MQSLRCQYYAVGESQIGKYQGDCYELEMTGD